ARAKTLFGDQANAFLKLYPAGTDDQAKRSAQDLAGDQFIAFSTWKWIELQAATGNSRVFRYEFDDAPPSAAKESAAPSRGAYHSAEIEFVFEALASKTSPGGQRTRSSLTSCLPTGPTSPRPGTRTVRVCLPGRLTAARASTKLCTSVRTPIRLRTSTEAGTNSWTRCLPISRRPLTCASHAAMLCTCRS